MLRSNSVDQDLPKGFPRKSDPCSGQPRRRLELHAQDLVAGAIPHCECKLVSQAGDGMFEDFVEYTEVTGSIEAAGLVVSGERQTVSLSPCWHGLGIALVDDDFGGRRPLGPELSESRV